MLDSALSAIITETVVLVPAAFLAVILRFKSRNSGKLDYELDDWFSAGALLMFILWQSLALLCAVRERKKPITQLTPPELDTYLKAVYVAEIFSFPSLAFSKLSVLYLYNRIFRIDHVFRIWAKVLFGINISLVIAGTSVAIFTCAKFYHPSLPGQSVNLELFTKVYGFADATIDFIMMVMPLNILRKLQMSSKDKVGLAFVFLLGTIVGTIGFIRIATVYGPDKFNSNSDGITCTVQQAAAIICCCLPTYRLLLQKINLLAIIRTRYVSLVKTITSAIRSIGSKKHKSTEHFTMEESVRGGKYSRFNELNNAGKGDAWALTHSEAAITGEDYSENGSYPLNSINIQRTVEIA